MYKKQEEKLLRVRARHQAALTAVYMAGPSEFGSAYLELKKADSALLAARAELELAMQKK